MYNKVQKLVPESGESVAQGRRQGEWQRQRAAKEAVRRHEPGHHEPGRIERDVMVGSGVMRLMDFLAVPIYIRVQHASVQPVFLKTPSDNHTDKDGTVRERDRIQQHAPPRGYQRQEETHGSRSIVRSE